MKNKQAVDAADIGDLLRGRRLKGRGRPRKDSTELTYAQLGLTRQQAWDWRKLGEIPKDEFEAFLTKCRVEGKRVSVRGMLVHFRLRNNVANDDIFADTPTGELATHLLKGFERIAPLMTQQERRWVIRAMRFQMRAIDLRVEMKETS